MGISSQPPIILAHGVVVSTLCSELRLKHVSIYHASAVYSSKFNYSLVGTDDNQGHQPATKNTLPTPDSSNNFSKIIWKVNESFYLCTIFPTLFHSLCHILPSCILLNNVTFVIIRIIYEVPFWISWHFWIRCIFLLTGLLYCQQ